MRSGLRDEIGVPELYGVLQRRSPGGVWRQCTHFLVPAIVVACRSSVTNLGAIKRWRSEN
jgi:hypothetical protein